MKVKSDQMAAVGNNYLKNRVVDGNKLELSLMDLEDIPVKDISELSAKITDVDLSCNRIINIPPTFCLLTNIVRLDLSKNSIENLPHDFGLLIKLQYLDLYNNQIEVLPVSFAYLKSLKWLDLKNNPLESHLKTVAGDCLDAKQCQTCAKKIVGFMQVVEQQLVHDQKEERKRVQAEENRRKVREEKEREKQQQQQSASTTARKLAKEKSSRESINHQQQQQHQMAPKSPVRNEPKSKARVVSAKQSQENGTKSKTSQKRSVLNTEGNNKAASASGRQSKQSSSKAKKNGGRSRFNWFSFTLYVTVIVLLAGIALAVFLKTSDSSGEVSLEAFKRTVLPIITEYAIKTCYLVTALLERVVAWLRTDGLEIAACLTGHACSILADVLEVCQYGLAHVQNVAWELCCKDVGATVTTNAKTM